MPEHSADTPEPISFGKYLLDEELARGGMSRVFRARLQGPAGFEKKLVVKQILPELAADPGFVELFVQEANTLVQLSHPNLVPVYELGVVDGVYFLAMEWVQGATVDLLLAGGPLPAPLVAQLGAQIADALQYAHERFGIVHRDVTPRNIIIDGAGHARLLDFGIAARTELTGQGELFGSPGYMAPEQLRGEPLGPESDLFSLGSVLYESVQGAPAWPNVRNIADFLKCPRPTLDEAVDPELSQVLLGLLDATRERRPQPASVVADRLRTWLAEHHPRGVLPELAARVLRAQTLVVHKPRNISESTRENSGRIEVRSLAVSPELAELLRSATERLERSPQPDQPAAPVAQAPSDLEVMSNDPELGRVARRFVRDIVVITLALMIALLYGRTRLARDPGSDTVAHGPPPSAASERAPTTSDAGAPAAARQAAQPEPEATPPAQPSAAPDTPTEHAVAPESLAPTDAHAKRGVLSVSAVPWAEVRVDGRLIGTTPRRSMPVRAGKHLVSLSCPPLAHSVQVPIELSSGQELHVSANMHESPPQVNIR